MIGWLRSPAVDQENPAVAAVERIHASAESAGALVGAGRGVGIPVDRALWICAAFPTPTAQSGWSPTRVTAASSGAGFLTGSTRSISSIPGCAGGHTDPVDVPQWLGGDAASPFRDGDGSADAGMIDELRTRILCTA
ncbi:hypothetical protein GCM10011575_19640 [Microlunatus endophyticus]|uniref:Uncharacterized protein n=1 Tax=Microlunatus endophyticus TaxID=1716077 RepID=A0A917S6D4_9ACTN|nr:hypothetical protein GCM10011575_19640 [Microlunatus endophyticus]